MALSGWKLPCPPEELKPEIALRRQLMTLKTRATQAVAGQFLSTKRPLLASCSAAAVWAMMRLMVQVLPDELTVLAGVLSFLIVTGFIFSLLEEPNAMSVREIGNRVSGR